MTEADDDPPGRVVVASAVVDDPNHGEEGRDGTASAQSQQSPQQALSQHHDVWNELVSWVNSSSSTDGTGWVHPHLELRVGDNVVTTGRGVFAAQAIRKGETLIRLPMNLSIHGQHLPHEYSYLNYCSSPSTSTPAGMEESSLPTGKRNASPWLRCLAAYLELGVATTTAGDGDHHHHHHPYLASLPESYETLWQWSDDEITHYLAGTRPPFTTNTDSNSWKIDWTALRQRYQQQIRPFLVHCHILKDHAATEESLTEDDEELQQFATACQVLSTRGFHMMEPTTVTHGNDDCYAGPFLLPVMDLLNHGSSPPARSTCTTLRRETNAFVMVAERDVAADQEILHSYDHDTDDDRNRMASSQFLASFGFVPRDRMERAAACHNHSPPPTAPVFLSKTEDVWHACWEVMDSEFPVELARRMREQDRDDEAWSLSVDRSRKADSVSNDILISGIPFHNDRAGKSGDETRSPEAWAQLHALTDELVTAVAVPLLPQCAYGEITDRTLLDRIILQDYFLGQLVGAVVLKIVEQKLASYTPVPDETMQQLLLGTSASTTYSDDDKKNGASLDLDLPILQRLLDLSNEAKIDHDIPWQQRQRLAYGLTVRIEEKNTLAALRRQAVTLMALLDLPDVNDDDEDVAVKKRKVEDE